MATAVKSPATQPLTTTLQLDLSRVEAGVPLTSMTEFAESSGIPMADLYNIVIPARTLKHRRARREPLSRDESDKFARLVRIYDYALKVFGEKNKANLWLSRPKHRFAERTPLQMLGTEIGGRMVEEFLVQIAYGMFA
jgi:putative toxin-antitoxin system antitoxin component (TIGR02293 family)